MRVDVIVMLAVAALIVGVLLYLPFFLWFRWRQSKGRPPVPGAFGAPIPRGRLGWYIAGVAVLAIGYAQAHLAPDTWFGATMKSSGGRLAFMIVLIVVFGGLHVLWLMLKRRRHPPAARDP